MPDYKEGIKREVAEIKFLIHDLRVERFINEIIHYHVTLDTELEIYAADQARLLHDADLQELKTRARDLRAAFEKYSNAVANFSPDKTILITGDAYIEAIYDLCDLILNPLWGRIDRVLSFLPVDSRSTRSRSHYRNCIRWICGVYYRIDHFRDEKEDKDVYEEWNVAEDLEGFTRNVVYGYVVEKSSARVELRLDELVPAVLGGNRHRFRRMYFNLIMNAVDALAGRQVGMIHIGTETEGDQLILRVRDNGSGMSEEKVQRLLTDKDSLDGELHSLGFVFVRQTVENFKGALSIDSVIGEGTTITVRVPYLPDAIPVRGRISRCAQFDLLIEGTGDEAGARKVGFGDEGTRVPLGKPEQPSEEKNAACGQMILHDYRTSDAPYPGCIFAIAMTEKDEIEFFTHRGYERLWNMSHEDLSPMFFEATIRGRLEEDDEKKPVLIFKVPQSVREYFEFKEIDETDRNADLYVQMVHDELIRVARKLVETGMDEQLGVLLTDAQKFFPGRNELIDVEPFALGDLAGQALFSQAVV